MKTLLLRLAGPMQSWGTVSRFTERDTGLEPSKSGVIGLLCAALGKPRDEQPLDGQPPEVMALPQLVRLASLRMGVRVDRPGAVGVDFQTAGGGKLGRRPYGVAKADGSKGEPVMSWRYYLQDASFLVGLESDDVDLLERLHLALQAPVWPLYLGRKSYVPGLPVALRDGLQDGDLLTVLAHYPADDADPVHGDLRVVLEEQAVDNRHLSNVHAERPQVRDVQPEVRSDVPLDFARRRFGPRHVRIDWVSMPGASVR